MWPVQQDKVQACLLLQPYIGCLSFVSQGVGWWVCCCSRPLLSSDPVTVDIPSRSGRSGHVVRCHVLSELLSSRCAVYKAADLCLLQVAIATPSLVVTMEMFGEGKGAVFSDGNRKWLSVLGQSTCSV